MYDLNYDRSIVVFDIGGTWFRSGLVSGNGKLEFFKKVESINYLTHPDLSSSNIQDKFVQYLLKQVELICSKHGEEINCVAISMGAALNANTGFLFNSGPLWGPNCKACDLVKILYDHNPKINWKIVNDITASLMWHVKTRKLGSGKTCLITVSTGIGCRIYDAKRNLVPVDRFFGLQGEIGHIPITFFINNKIVEQTCDCGGKNHLNAFCSGRGIEKIFPIFVNEYIGKYGESSVLFKKSNVFCMSDFLSALKDNDKFAFYVLQKIIEPLASMIIHLLTFDPEIETIILTGGVVHGLSPYYFSTLLDMLNKIGIYQITEYDREYLAKRITMGEPGDMTGLLGAAICCYNLATNTN